MLVVCILLCIKRDAFINTSNKATSRIVGDKITQKLNRNPAQRQANLMAPMFGGMAFGCIILIMSLTGAFR